jgi:hypothetical protein
MNYARFRLDEWTALQKKAHDAWVKNHLGKPPDKKSIRKTISNPFFITMLEWAAVAVLAVAMVFTFLKMGVSAVAYVEDLVEALGHGQPVHEAIRGIFSVTAIIFFGLLSTPGLIYFQLFDRDDKEIQHLKEETARKAARYQKWLGVSPYIFTLEYLTPRLPGLMVYAITIWLIYISSAGNGSFFEKYVPVIAEVAFAHLVGDIISKRSAFSRLVTQKYDEQLLNWELRRDNYETDKTYRKTLYQYMREGLAGIKRTVGGKDTQINRNWVEVEASAADLHNAIMSEYLRLNDGDNFADQIDDFRKHQGSAPKAAASVESLPFRLPPNGQTAWTPSSLLTDLRIMNFKPSEMNEAKLKEVYGGEHKARQAWRGGARDHFLAQ